MQVANSHHAAAANNNNVNTTNSTAGQPNSATAQSMASLASASSASTSSNASTASTSSSSSSTSLSSFSEQVGLVINLFQDWNDCERSVSLFAVLKRIPFSCTKFLQSVIDANLAQTFAADVHSKQLERNANSASHVRWLHDTYRCLDGGGGGPGANSARFVASSYASSGSVSSSRMNSQSNRESLFGDSDANAQPSTSRQANGQPTNVAQHHVPARPTPLGTLAQRRESAPHGTTTAGDAQRYARKEDILNDILTLLPILTPGNEEAKSAYLELIPAAVDDAIRGAVNTTLVQQMFSYVLIHPAFAADDRRSLNRVLRHLEDHIVNADPMPNAQPQQTTSAVSNPARPTNQQAARSTVQPSGSTLALSSASAPHIASKSWQAIAPPASSSRSSETIHSSWMDASGSGGVGVGVGVGNQPPSTGAGVPLQRSPLLMERHRMQQHSHQHHNHHHQLQHHHTINGAAASAATLSLAAPMSLNAATSPVGLERSPALAVASIATNGRLFEPHNDDDGNGAGAVGGCGDSSNSSQTNDDHHVSFSKNGTEILDFEADDDTDKSNTQIGFDTLANLTDFSVGAAAAAVPSPALLTSHRDSIGSGAVGDSGLLCIDGMALKTRRSNSLTTAAAAGYSYGAHFGNTVAGSPAGGGIGALGGFGNTLSAQAGGGAGSLVIGGSGGGCGSGGSGSAQNLGQLMMQQKPRSYSLSMAAGSRLGVGAAGGIVGGGGGGSGCYVSTAMSSGGGSDTRLDDFRTAMHQQQQHNHQQQQQQQHQHQHQNQHQHFSAIGPSSNAGAAGFHNQFATLSIGNTGQNTTGATSPASTNASGLQSQQPPPAPPAPPAHHNVGMANIGQWLKSLRLHKYVWLFSNITYEQMLAISEEYLQQLNVTKGARHKLVVCIQRLQERHTMMQQLEKDLMLGRTTMLAALDELTGVVLTPMRPVEPYNKLDVGGQFLRVLNLVSNLMINKHINSHDEEPINTLLWILDKAVHNEAFVAHTNQLKEHRYKVTRIKAQFPPKPSHFGAAIGAGVCTPPTTVGGINVNVNVVGPTVCLNSVEPNVTPAPPPPPPPPTPMTSNGSSSRPDGGTSLAAAAAAASIGCLSQARYSSDYADYLTPTSSMAPWRHHWTASDAANVRANSSAEPHSSAGTQTNGRRSTFGGSDGGRHLHVCDSDYHSMTSSRSNSIESLNELLSAATALTTTTKARQHARKALSSSSSTSLSSTKSAFDVDGCGFEWPMTGDGVGKLTPTFDAGSTTSLYTQSPSFVNDFYTSPLARMSAMGALTAATALNPVPLRRFTFGGAIGGGGGCGDGGCGSGSSNGSCSATSDDRSAGDEIDDSKSVTPVPKKSFETAKVCSEKGTVDKTSQPHNKTATIPTSVALPNMNVPPPNLHASCHQNHQLYANIPAKLRRTSLLPSPVSTTRKTPADISDFDATKPPPPLFQRRAKAANVNGEQSPSVQPYRPRELRQTPLQNLQPPSVAKANQPDTSTVTPKFALMAPPPSTKRTNPPPMSSKIAAKFDDPPPTPMTNNVVHVAIISPSPPKVPKTEAKSKTCSQLSVDFPALTPAAATVAAAVSNSTVVNTYRTPERKVVVAAAATTGHKTLPQPSRPSLASIVRTTLPQLMLQQPTNVPVPPPATSNQPKPPAPQPATTPATSTVGMSDVNAWLKSLRLHKYQYVFVDMSYAAMLAIDEALLERLQITKGARNKLVLSVLKLRDRCATLERIERELQQLEPRNAVAVTLIGQLLDELNEVAQSPMKPAGVDADKDDVAGRLMTVLNVAFERTTGWLKAQQKSHVSGDELQQCAGKLAWLLDVAVHSEGCAAFRVQLRQMRQRVGFVGATDQKRPALLSAHQKQHHQQQHCFGQMAQFGHNHRPYVDKKW